jgi:hypothetical protein
MTGVTKSKLRKRRSVQDRDKRKRARLLEMEGVAREHTNERSQIHGPLRDLEFGQLSLFATAAEYTNLSRPATSGAIRVEDLAVFCNWTASFQSFPFPHAEMEPQSETIVHGYSHGSACAAPADTYGVRRKNQPRILLEDLYMVSSMLAVYDGLAAVLFKGLIFPTACSCRTHFAEDKMVAFFALFGEWASPREREGRVRGAVVGYRLTD